jgi:hypothetical protein
MTKQVVELPVACGWCGTPFNREPWCDHCEAERAARLSPEQRSVNHAGVTAARAALRAARGDQVRLVGSQHRKPTDRDAGDG